MNDLDRSRSITTTDRRIILVGVSVASFLTAFMTSALNVAIPAIGRDLSLSAVAMTWVMTTYLGAVLQVPFGRLADIVGRKRLYSLGLVLVGFFSVLIALCSSAAALLTLRVLQGIAAAMIFSTAVPIIVSVYPKSDRGYVLGINTALVYAGMTVGPSIGGVITHHLGWRGVFWAVAATSLLGLVPVILRYHEEKRKAGSERFDFTGAISSCTASRVCHALRAGYS
jgi:MFS family permease